MPPPLVVLTVAARTMARLRRLRDAAEGADMVELRLDGVEDLDVGAALEGCRLPAIVTCRPRWEGGRFDGSEEERSAILAAALDLGARYVDVEWRAGFNDLIASRGGRNIVVSSHDFSGVPRDVEERAAAMRATGAEVVKLAVMASSLGDCLRLLGIGRAGGIQAPSESGVVLLAMGEAGLATRILASRFRSRWTYAGDAAPGQLPLSRLLDEFRFRKIGPATDLYGIAGAPVAHSVSPAIHNAALAALGMDAVYVPLHASSAEEVLAFAEALALKGASVTSPLKEEMAARVHLLDAISRRLGAVNTIGRTSTGWSGINTDVTGFLAPLAGRIELAGCRAAIIGAGGAARAAAAALGWSGAIVSVYGRNRDRARAVAALAGGAGFDGLPVRRSWDLLVNATPVGTFPVVDETPIPASELGGGTVYDLVYNPLRTRLVREAEAAGCPALGGFDMLVTQAQLQLAWWIGRRSPAGVMRRAGLAALQAFTTKGNRHRHPTHNSQTRTHDSELRTHNS